MIGMKGRTRSVRPALFCMTLNLVIFQIKLNINRDSRGGQYLGYQTLCVGV